MTEPTTFKVSWSDHEVQIDGRQAAVDFAKSKSVEVAPQSVAAGSATSTARKKSNWKLNQAEGAMSGLTGQFGIPRVSR